MTGLLVWILIVIVVAAIATWAVHYNTEDSLLTGITLVVCLVFGGLTTLNLWAVTYRNDHWVTCHVTGKDRGGDNGSYRVYTSDCGQLGNEDSTFRTKFNSGDLWQQIPDKGVVRFEVAGSRWHPVSQFPNIFAVEVIDDETA